MKSLATSPDAAAVPAQPTNQATTLSIPTERTASDPSTSYSGAEKRVLEHAADILGIPYEALVALNSVAPTAAEHSTSSTTPQTTPPTSYDPELSLDSNPALPARPVQRIHWDTKSDTNSGAWNHASPRQDSESLSDWVDFGPLEADDQLTGLSSHASAPILSRPSDEGSTFESRSIKPLDTRSAPGTQLPPLTGIASGSLPASHGEHDQTTSTDTTGFHAPLPSFSNGLIEGWEHDLFADVDFSFDNVSCSFTMDPLDLMSFDFLQPTGAESAQTTPIQSADSAANIGSSPESPMRPVSSSTQLTRPAGVQRTPLAKKRGVRGPFKTTEERLETGLTRQIGACIRCIKQKARVRLNTVSQKFVHPFH